MNKLEKMKKKIKHIVEKMSVEEIIERIEEDKKEFENIELVYNWELEEDLKMYTNKNNYSSGELKEEVNIWKEEMLELVA